jgi:hypothetical protein
MSLDHRDDDRDAYITWATWLLGDVSAGLAGGREPGAKTILRLGLVGELVGRAGSGAASLQADLKAAVGHLKLMVGSADGDARITALPLLVRVYWMLLGQDDSDDAVARHLVAYGRRRGHCSRRMTRSGCRAGYSWPAASSTS